MPAKSHNDSQGLFHSAAIYSSPWWREVGNCSTFGDSASKPSAVKESMNGSHADSGLQGSAKSNKEDTQIAMESRSDGDHGQETHLKQIPLSAPLTVGGHLEMNSHMELLGHSIVLTSYPHSDPQYSGMLTSYPTQAMVHPHLYGMHHHARMPLPLEMEEEPVYVNAKQFHGILRRRQARAKAELEKKAIKNRKPYLHESRHKHAMRRARGCGGRFLSSKKSANDSTKSSVCDKDVSSQTVLIRQSSIISSGSEWLLKDANGDSDSSCGRQNNPSCISNGYGQSSTFHLSSGDGLNRGFFGQQRESTHRNGSQMGVQSIT